MSGILMLQTHFENSSVVAMANTQEVPTQGRIPMAENVCDTPPAGESKCST